MSWPRARTGADGLPPRRSRPAPPSWLSLRAAAVAAGTSLVLYALMAVWVLPGVLDIVAALPVGARLGVLLLASTVTRFAAGWFAARRYRADRGLRSRVDAVPSAAVGGLAAWALLFLLSAAGGSDASAAAIAVDAVRWPAECAVGALLALPGPAGRRAGG